MSKVVPIRFSDEEYLKIIGAAAVANMPVSTYMRWLISERQQPGANDGIGKVLSRLDEIAGAIAAMKKSPAPTIPSNSKTNIDRNVLVAKLRERGIPSGTIKQVEAVLEDMEKQ